MGRWSGMLRMRGIMGVCMHWDWVGRLLGDLFGW